MPDEPVTFDDLEQLLLWLTGNSAETLEQQLQSRLKRETLVGGKRVARQQRGNLVRPLPLLLWPVSTAACALNSPPRSRT